MLRSRRRPNYGAQACALFSALLLLVSVSLLYTRLSLFSSHSHSHSHHHLRTSSDSQGDDALLFHNSLVSDSEEDSSNSSSKDDKIDEHDDTPEEDQNDAAVNSAFNEEEENQEVDQEQETESDRGGKFPSSGYYFDHFNGVIRRTFSKRSIEEWDYDYAGFNVGLGGEDFDYKSKTAFGSDDIPVDEEVRGKMSDVSGIEDALLLKIGKKVSPLRQGWGDWFDRKGDFLRRDRMFKSNLEVLNPMNNPLLQDPDGIGITGLTRGDRAVQKWLLNEFKRVPFMAKKPLSVSGINREASLRENDAGIKVGRTRIEKRVTEGNVEARSDGFKRPERKTLDNDVGVGLNNKRANNGLSRKDDMRKDSSIAEKGEMGGLKNVNSKAHESWNEFSGHIYADGKRWGYFPGLDPMLSFSDFMDVFFRKGKCKMRVFMVWNSPPWMYSVRHQRGLESLLGHHRGACVVVFSETMELDFFKDSFVKDGYKVAVAMPNLDELLKDTPAHIFASVWFEWRKAKFYATHYSELVRLAALYKYGGIYLDSDIIVLGSLSSLNNSVGKEGQLAGDSLNGAVMAFRRHSPFILECLREYYMTYDDTRLRWNGADLLTRVSRNFFNKQDMLTKQSQLNVQPSFIFFPISPRDVVRYFTTPATEIEEEQQEALFKKILSESLTFHLWDYLTATLTPEPLSLATKLIDFPCIRCSDVL